MDLAKSGAPQVPTTTARERFALDLLEQIAVVLLYGWMTFRLWPGELTATNWYPLLIIPSEGLVVVLLLIRRRTERISTSWMDWMIAFGGTTAVLAIDKGGPAILGMAGPMLMIMGLALHIAAKVSLGRSFGLVAAHRGLKTSGLYQYVRHPIYAGYLLSHIGFLLAAPSFWNVAVYVVAWSLMVARIYAEERVLSEDPEYCAYKEKVRYRLIPGVF